MRVSLRRHGSLFDELVSAKCGSARCRCIPRAKTVRASVEAMETTSKPRRMKERMKLSLPPNNYLWCQRVRERQSRRGQTEANHGPLLSDSAFSHQRVLLSYDLHRVLEQPRSRQRTWQAQLCYLDSRFRFLGDQHLSSAPGHIVEMDKSEQV